MDSLTLQDYTDIGFGTLDKKKSTKNTLEFQKEPKCGDPLWDIMKCISNTPFRMIQYTTSFLLERRTNGGDGQGQDYKGHNGCQISETLLVQETVPILNYMHHNGMILGHDN